MEQWVFLCINPLELHLFHIFLMYIWKSCHEILANGKVC